MMPAVKAAAQHPDKNVNHKAGTGLKVAASNQVHQPRTTLHSREQLPHNHQQAAACAFASIPEPDIAQPASTAILQQPHGADDGSSPFNSSQLASPDPSADSALKQASVRSVTPGSTLAPTQDEDLSMQQDLTVNRLESPQEALPERNLQQADAVGTLSLATQKETLQDSGHQSAQPGCNLGDMSLLQSDSFSTAHTAQDADSVEPYDALIHNEREIFASDVLQLVPDTASPAREAPSGSRPASATFNRAPEVADLRRHKADLRRRKPFSWRKHGRSWRHITSKE